MLKRHRDKVVAILSAAGFSNPHIFGSVARGEDRVGSDIDLMVTFPPGTSLFRVIEVELTLGDLLGCEVQILGDAALMKSRIAERVTEDLKPL